VDLFNKGDFAGVASLFTADATAFPPGSGMVKGRAAIETMWKSMAEQVSDPKLTTLDVKPLGPSAAAPNPAAPELMQRSWSGRRRK
jgi:ketosteroid isomerase-like protein